MRPLGFKRVLALSPHPDDVELGCGGTVARLLREEAAVVAVRCTDAAWWPPALETEDHEACRRLGMTREEFAPGRARKLHEKRVELLDYLCELRRDLEPDLVLCPSAADQHQDHRVVTEEALRAFRGVPTWGYELPWNCRRFESQLFVGLSADDLAHKLEAVAVYGLGTQGSRSYMDPEFLSGLARVRGVQAGVQYAEAFEVLRHVV